jgi:hypothetical protein
MQGSFASLRMTAWKRFSAASLAGRLGQEGTLFRQGLGAGILSGSVPFYKPTEVSRQLPQVPSGNRRPLRTGSAPASPPILRAGDRSASGVYSPPGSGGGQGVVRPRHLSLTRHLSLLWRFAIRCFGLRTSDFGLCISSLATRHCSQI